MNDVGIDIGNQSKDSKSTKPPEQNRYTFSWSDVNYSISVGKGKEKQVLFGVSGSVKSGDILAIMGGSGAGKTTMLKCLAGRIEGGILSGSILFDGKKRDSKTWPVDCTYVEQDDLFHAKLTVQETLMYAARLRMPESTSLANRTRVVNEIIMDLGLNNCRNSYIGGENMRGISGGERKRVSIAQELLMDPYIIFLDEPTSGLDAFTAFNVIQSIKNIAEKRNKIVIMTIHQPRTDIINLIDKILLLSGGKTVWHGSTVGGLNHFATLGYEIPPNTNSSDFFMDCITLDRRNATLLDSSTKRVDKLVNGWQDYVKKNPLALTNRTVITEARPLQSRSRLSELFVLLSRDFRLIVRDADKWKGLLLTGVGANLLIGILFWQQKLDSSGVHNRVGVIFFQLVSLTFICAMPLMVEIPVERTMVKRERASGAISPFGAYVSKWLSSLPLMLGNVILVSTPMFFTVGYNSAQGRFFKYFIAMTSQLGNANALGLFIGSSAKNSKVSAIIGPLIMSVFIIFAGFTVNLEALSDVFKWIQFISPMCYANKALVQNELKGVKLVCESPLKLCFNNGDSVIKYYGMGNVDYAPAILYLLILTFGFLIAGAFSFERLSRPSRLSG